MKYLILSALLLSLAGCGFPERGITISKEADVIDREVVICNCGAIQ